MDPKFRTVPEEIWAVVAPQLPLERPKPKGGRPRVPDRVVLAGTLYRLRTGCQWHALPAEFGSGSTCHARHPQWAAAGVFTQAFAAASGCRGRGKPASVPQRPAQRSDPAAPTACTRRRVSGMSPAARVRF
jgi:transposase